MTTAARLDKGVRDEFGPPDGDHEDVGFTAKRRQVVCAGMGDGDGGVLVQQHLGGRLADDAAAADDDSAAAGNRDTCQMQERHDRGC